MQPTPPNPPDKEGPFLPWLETQGHPGPASVIEFSIRYGFLMYVKTTIPHV
jgi:hypothetical protein